MFDLLDGPGTTKFLIPGKEVISPPSILLYNESFMVQFVEALRATPGNVNASD
jgi:hypothetical protein